MKFKDIDKLRAEEKALPDIKVKKGDYLFCTTKNCKNPKQPVHESFIGIKRFNALSLYCSSCEILDTLVGKSEGE